MYSKGGEAVKNFPWKVKISHLLTAGFLGLVVVPFLLLVVYNLLSFTKQANEQLLQDGNYVLHSIEHNIGEKLDSIETVVGSLAYNSSLTAFLSHSYDEASSFEEYSQTVLPILQSVADSASPPIQRFWIISQNRILPDGQSILRHASTAQLNSLEDFLDEHPNGGWYYNPDELIPNSLENYLSQEFYFIRAISSPYGRRAGYAVAKVQASALFGDFLKSKDTQRIFFLLNEENRPYMSNVSLDEDFRFPDEPPSRKGLQPVLYLSVQSDRLPLRLGLAFSSLDRRVLLENFFLAIFAVLTISLIFLISFYHLLQIIVAHLRAYASNMTGIAASGFNGRLEVSNLYELGIIGTQFNDTLTEIHSLLQEKIQQETAYKDIQLQALLLQINPHFIYNTLDMFSGRLALNGEYEMADYISDFAGMLRYNTSKPGMFLTLGEEIEYTQNYVNLQRCRYGASITLRLHVTPDLKGAQVLRLLLQPVVENSFVHGFAQMPPDASRKVIITARTTGGFMVIRVRDNGWGIPLQEVQRMNKKFASPSMGSAPSEERPRGNIGLENINQRLSLFYAGQGRVFIRSVPGRYTSVFLTFKL